MDHLNTNSRNIRISYMFDEEDEQHEHDQQYQSAPYCFQTVTLLFVFSLDKKQITSSRFFRAKLTLCTAFSTF